MNHNGYLVKWNRYVVDEVRDDKWEKVQVGDCVYEYFTDESEFRYRITELEKEWDIDVYGYCIGDLILCHCSL